MARLPTQYDLSQSPGLRSGRQVASYDTSGLTRGVQQLANGLDAVGDAYARKEKEARDQQNVVDVSRAEAEKTKGLLDVQNQFENDPDYSTFDKRGNPEIDKAITTSANLIRDPKMREAYIAKQQETAVRSKDWLTDKATDKKRSAEIVSFDDALETNRRLYVDPATPDDIKAKARKDIEASISQSASTGLLTPEQAANRRLDYLEKADLSRGYLAVKQNPDVISKPLPANVSQRSSDAMGYFQSRGWSKEQAAGIVGNLLAESTLNTSANNAGDGADGSDSIGIAQWNGDRAKRLKEFAKQNKADWHDYGIQLAFVDNELRTTHKSIGDNLRNAKDVQSATDAAVMFEGPQGSEKGPRNAHNYSGRLKYAQQAAGENANPDWYDRLSPEQKQSVQEQADTERRRYAVQDKADIDIAAANAPAAIMSTGTYTGQMPSADKFLSAYGPEEGGRRYQEFQASIETSQQAHGMQTMTGAEIQKMVEGEKPTSSGDDAALQTAKYSTLAKAAATTIAARESDPVTYVRNSYPSVDQAWENATQTGNYQAAITATTAAQQQLGIRNRSVLPKDVADMAAARFKDANLPEGDRLSAVSGLVFATRDPAQRSAIFEQLVSAGVPDAMQGAIEAQARGDEGAARRLSQAAIIDPSKLPGATPEKTSAIDGEIQAKLMDKGQIGNVYYGLSDGTADNFTRAQRDAKLITNSVLLRMGNGEDMETAINNVSKDLYGDLKIVTGNPAVNAQILIPSDQDETPVLNGLAKRMPDVEKHVADTIAKVPVNLEEGMGNEAVMKAVRENYAKNVAAQGYFKSAVGGYVFIDPFRGAALSDDKGKPIIYTPAEATKGYLTQTVTPDQSNDPGAVSAEGQSPFDKMTAPLKTKDQPATVDVPDEPINADSLQQEMDKAIGQDAQPGSFLDMQR